LLHWSQVDWGARQIRRTGKGGKLVTIPITATIREILWPLRGHHPEHVFTYVAVRTHRGWVKGRRYPTTLAGLRAHWHRLRKAAGVTGFRFHDFRHDLATKALRETGNIKLVQRMLNHADIRHTLRYAHVLDAEVAEGFERVAESRKKSRTVLRKVG
jgi:integrase